jgi:hypothetical protein
MPSALARGITDELLCLCVKLNEAQALICVRLSRAAACLEGQRGD